METAYIAVGANLPSVAGSPRETLDAAILQMGKLGRVVARSAYHVTEPVGYADQPEFLNGAVALEAEMEPEALLYGLMGIEQEFGRDRSSGMQNGPRTLDLDLLLYGERVIETEALQVPHPRMTVRSFVLLPLLEIAPRLIHPQLGQSVAQLVRQLPCV